MTQATHWRQWLVAPAGEPFIKCHTFPAQPGLWDLRQRPEVIAHWTAILRGNSEYLRQLVVASGDPDKIEAVDQILPIYRSLLDDLDSGEAIPDITTIHDVTVIRERLLRAHNLRDPYLETKRQQAETIRVSATDACESAWAAGGESGAEGAIPQALVYLLAEVYAGNLFDLGSKTTRDAFRAGTLDISSAGERIRPWVAETLKQMDPEGVSYLLPAPVTLTEPGEGKVLLFADNAGPDFLLGVLPLALYLARRWTVALVVNSDPASSDITYTEAEALLSEMKRPASAVLQAIDSKRLELVPSGTGSPGIDLRHVGSELNAAAADAAWLILEGQGRSVETNWDTCFHCPAFRLAMVKDELVAQEIGIDQGSPVLRYDSSGGNNGG
jgi:uncharacterized protein with ATP-grasp and redox domains